MITREIRYASKEKLWYREGSHDLDAWREVSTWRHLGLLSSDRVLDLGCHIGAFIRRVALPARPELIVGIEPDPETFRVLRRNVEPSASVVLHNAAVTAWGGDVSFFVSPTNSLAHSLYVTRGREEIVVPSLAMSELLRRYHPTVLKVDIEGAEFSIGLDELPDYVRAFGVEYHLKKKRWRDEFPNLLARIEASGFRSLKPVSRRDWNPEAIYVRV